MKHGLWQTSLKLEMFSFGFTFSLLIMASSESIDNDKPCINRFASILA